MAKCFVIMSFDEGLRSVYYAVEQAARDKRFSCERGDSSLAAEDVPDTIIKKIVAADVVVADLSQPRPNVYFELGIAYSTRRPTICISQSTDLPFDVRNYRIVIYDAHRLDELQLRLREAFDNLDRYRENPVLESGKAYFDLHGKIKENLEATIRDRRRAAELGDFLRTEWADNAPVANELIDRVQKKCDVARGKRVIAVSGAGSIGKSTFSRLLQEQFTERFPELTVDILPTDAYMMERSERLAENITGFDIRSHNLKTFESDLASLINGSDISVRPYDHGTGKHGDERTVRSPDLLILEGIHSFHPPVYRYLDFLVFIYSTRFIVRELKFLADALCRGYSPATAFEHSEREYTDYEEHVLPYHKHADAVAFVEGYWRYRLGAAEGRYEEPPNNGIQRTPLLRCR